MANYGIFESLKNKFFSVQEPVNTTAQSTGYEIENLLTPGIENIDFPDAIFNSRSNIEKQKNEINSFEKKDRVIRICRTISSYPEVSNVIDEHVSEMLNEDLEGKSVKIDFSSDFDKKDNTKKTLEEAFEKTLRLLNWKENADDIIKNWYIDGFYPVEYIYEKEKEKNGILGIAHVDPIGLNRIRVNNKHYWTRDTNISKYHIKDVSSLSSYFDEEQLFVLNSGLMDSSKTFYISHLNSAVKPANNLQQIEDSLIIYRLLKSAEKNVWNVDVGSMPKTKAENYLQQVKQNIQSEFNYDTATGELHGTSAVRSIMEDWIFPSRNGNSKTSVETMGGNSNFTDNLDDIEYFLKKLYKALKYPITRIDGDSTLDFSNDDILRDEVKYLKLLQKFKRRINSLFLETMKREVIAKGQMDEEEFYEVSQGVSFVWSEINHIIERSKINNLKERAEAIEDLNSSGIVGKYISANYLINNVLGMTDSEYEEQKKLIQQEKKDGLYDED